MKWPCWDRLFLNFNWHMSSITLWRASLSNYFLLSLYFFSLLARADDLVWKLKKKLGWTKEILIIFYIGDKWSPLYLDLHSFHFFILPAKFYVGLTIFSKFYQYKNHHYPSFTNTQIFPKFLKHLTLSWHKWGDVGFLYHTTPTGGCLIFFVSVKGFCFFYVYFAAHNSCPKAVPQIDYS